MSSNSVKLNIQRTKKWAKSLNGPFTKEGTNGQRESEKMPSIFSLQGNDH